MDDYYWWYRSMLILIGTLSQLPPLKGLTDFVFNSNLYLNFMGIYAVLQNSLHQIFNWKISSKISCYLSAIYKIKDMQWGVKGPEILWITFYLLLDVKRLFDQRNYSKIEMKNCITFISHFDYLNGGSFHLQLFEMPLLCYLYPLIYFLIKMQHDRCSMMSRRY